MKLARLALSALVFSFGAVSPALSHAQGYAVLDLGFDVIAYGLNDIGQVAGADYREQGGGRAFFTGINGTGITYVDGLPEGIDASSVSSSINNQGQVAGTYSDLSFNSLVFVAGANGRVVQTTEVLSDGYGGIINNNGQIAGSQNGRIAVFESQTGETTLRGGVDDAIRLAFGFNDKGQVVGRDYSSNLGFVSNSDGSFQNLGVLGDDSSAYAINNAGWAVGSARDASNRLHAVLATPDSNSLIDLTPLAVFAEARAINESGQVVGFVIDDAGERRAFMTGANGQGLVDLNSLVQLGGGFVFDFAHGINNVGQIIASGSDGHSYLLTPTAIPEPGTVALWMLGLLGVGVATRRQRH